jgi:hypothetical protein
VAPAGSANGLLTYAGSNIAFLNPNVESPYSMRLNLGLQHEFSKDLMLEVNYIGNHAVHLPLSVTQLNGIPRQYLSTLPVRDNSVSYLGNSTPNPFAGLQTTQNGGSASIAQVLSRYPEFPVGDAAGGWSGSGGILEDNANVGSSFFESLNVQLQKRLSSGLQVIGGYSKLTEFDSWLNDSDSRPEKRISPMDRTNHFVAAVVYELPFGKNKLVDVKNRSGQCGGWRLADQQHLHCADRCPARLGERQFEHPGRLCLLRGANHAQQSQHQQRCVQHLGVRRGIRGSVPISRPHVLDDLWQPSGRRRQQFGRFHPEAFPDSRKDELPAAVRGLQHPEPRHVQRTELPLQCWPEARMIVPRSTAGFEAGFRSKIGYTAAEGG